MADNTEATVEETEVVEEADVQETEQAVEDDDFGIADDFVDDTHVTIVEGGEIVDLDEEDEGEDEESEDEAITAEETDEQDEDEAEDEEAAGTDEEAQAPEGDEEEDSEESPTEPVAEATATEPTSETTQPETKTEPLPFKVDGREFTVEGREDGDNYVIPKEEWNRKIQPRLADKSIWQQERESYQRQIAALDPQNNPEVIRAREVMENFHNLLNEGPDAVIEWAEDFERNKEVLLAKAEAEAARAEAERYRGAHTEAERQQSQEELGQMLDTGLSNLLERASQHEDYQGLDMDYVKRILSPMREAIFFRAPQDMPEANLRKGEIGVNLKVVQNVLDAEAERTRASREKINAATAASEARKRNEAVLKEKKPVPPPAGKEVSDPKPRRQNRPRTKEEWDKQLSALARG